MPRLIIVLDFPAENVLATHVDPRELVEEMTDNHDSEPEVTYAEWEDTFARHLTARLGDVTADDVLRVLPADPFGDAYAPDTGAGPLVPQEIQVENPPAVELPPVSTGADGWRNDDIVATPARGLAVSVAANAIGYEMFRHDGRPVRSVRLPEPDGPPVPMVTVTAEEGARSWAAAEAVLAHLDAVAHLPGGGHA